MFRGSRNNIETVDPEPEAPRLNASANSATGRATLAHALLCDGQYDAALAELEVALKDNPELADGQLVKGITLARKGRYHDAIAPLRMAMKSREHARDAALSLIVVYLRLEYHERAARVAQQLTRGGYLADRFGKTNRRHVLTAPAIGMTVAIPIAISAYWVEDWRIALLLVLLPTLLNALYVGPTYSCAQGLVPLRARAMASAVMLFAQNLIGLGLGPLFFGIVSDIVKPMAGDESVRWVLYGAAFMGLIPSFFFWRASLRLNTELDKKS